MSDSMFEDDAFAASQSLEEELLGKGYFMNMETPLGSSLAAELHSAGGPAPPSTVAPPLSPPVSHHGNSKLASMAMNRSLSSSPVLSPIQWSHAMSTSTSAYGRSRRSSFSSTWSSLDQEDDDPFEVLKRQLEELNSAVWETKTLHKRLFNTLLADDQQNNPLKNSNKYTPPLELVITSVANLVESKSRDRERQTSSLRNLDSSIRKEIAWMPLDAIKELEALFASMKTTLYDQAYSYENPLPAIHKLNIETSSMTESLEELKEIMYVNKRQVQELNSRLRSIAKTVHEVRKDIRRINKFLEEKDDDDAVVLEKGEVQERVKDIMWGLDDLDAKSSREIQQMQMFWEGSLDTVATSTSS
ncbi:hypothetical protein BDB00DRAFT_755763 [Zychaea mexicana]|uniref:uncharacterized protein n=1 Tax=Zychaea mexicana TaxID=64656 RepID=UPI0022FEAC5A|nr:uncharacterized protein BDB00DRAFT_755763 [Zychaea mexicana]KAI9497978.1 hypothetical protein BDB00DRAFT_755763 [Zychaea mexicana]